MFDTIEELVAEAIGNRMYDAEVREALKAELKTLSKVSDELTGLRQDTDKVSNLYDKHLDKYFDTVSGFRDSLYDPENVRELKENGLIDTKQVTDGWHSFEELYYHRMKLFALICHMNKDVAWKSWKHHDGTMFDGSFIVGVETPEGQYSYHYKAEYWDTFDVKEWPFAPTYDGHQPSDIGRLDSLLKPRMPF